MDSRDVLSTWRDVVVVGDALTARIPYRGGLFALAFFLLLSFSPYNCLATLSYFVGVTSIVQLALPQLIGRWVSYVP